MRLLPQTLRASLAAFFALGAGSVLAAVLILLHAHLTAEFDDAVNAGLRRRAADVAAALEAGDPAVSRGEGFAQVLDPAGTVVAASSTLAADRTLLDRAELGRALVGETLVDRRVPGLGQEGRLLARPVVAQGRQLLVVVGASKDPTDRAQHRVTVALAVAGPLMVGGLAFGGWLLAGAALRPVQRMSERATVISLREPDARLPEPPGNDEIATLGRTLNAMLERMEAAFAHERAFVDDASHEIRTPVSVLRAELELALLDARDDSVKTSLRSALEETDRLSRLAENLLVLARADADRLGLRVEPVKLRAVVDDVVARVLGQPDGGSPRPRISVTGSDAVVAADAVRLEQVVTNLVTNACRFARSLVAIEVSEAGDHVVLQVADDGPGFPPAVLPEVFDRFLRADSSRGRTGGGSGLGLSIVAAIVRGHGGRVTAANGPPLGGAAVRVELPRGD
ncbi:MAG TPA: ATP-binding protein [Acidimicrobiales bacterium]|nr:ATP-binding protein [Acidimicrobiales bacterium]